MTVKPNDYRTIEKYTGRKIKFIPDLERKIKHAEHIANEILRGMR